MKKGRPTLGEAARGLLSASLTHQLRRLEGDDSEKLSCLRIDYSRHCQKGYDPGALDGVIDDDARAAIREFQDNGIRYISEAYREEKNKKLCGLILKLFTPIAARQIG